MHNEIICRLQMEMTQAVNRRFGDWQSLDEYKRLAAAESQVSRFVQTFDSLAAGKSQEEAELLASDIRKQFADWLDGRL